MYERFDRRRGYRDPMSVSGGPDELRALARLTFQELGDATGGIGGIHRGIAGRVFRAVGPMSAPARAAHDAISEGVYRALRGGATLAGLGADRGLARRAVRDGRALS